MQNRTGLVSISFRSHTPEEILAAVKDAGLSAVEWGGDVHVPHGDKAAAKRIKALSDSFGISIPEYGSYYAIGKSDPELFDAVLATAKELGTDIIRVWAGQGKPSDTYSREEYEAAVADAKRICDLSGDITVALECHPNTLTDEYHTAHRFITDVGRENLKMFWQPNQHRPLEYNIDSIRALLPYIVSVHVFSWRRKEKFPLAALEIDWLEYIKLLSGKSINYMLEFMHDGNIETLKETAKVLNSWIK